MIKDTHTRMEKYHTWEKAQRSHIRSRKRRASHKDDKQAERRQCFWRQIYLQVKGSGIHHKSSPTPHMQQQQPTLNSEGEVKQERKFLGKYCKFCARCNETHFWCNSSNWEEELININDPNSNPSIEKIPSPTVRKSPVVWFMFRCRVIREAELARPPSPAEEASTDSGIRMQ